jgi:hypothetical protein
LNTFTWLLVGHLVGDWLLQNDWMARGKKNGPLTLAGVVHFAVYTAATTGAFWLSGAKPTCLIGAAGILLVSHWLIDVTDAAGRWMCFYGQSNDEMVRVVVDQAMHLLVLALLAAWLSPA